MAAGRVIDAGLHLLDRQVLDPDEHHVCKVDDLELAVPEDGGAPYVTAILAGPGVLGRRLGGVFRRVLNRAPESRIDFGVVDEVGSAIRIALRREELSVSAIEAWCRDHVIARIPGSAHADE